MAHPETHGPYFLPRWFSFIGVDGTEHVVDCTGWWPRKSAQSEAGLPGAPEKPVLALR